MQPHREFSGCSWGGGEAPGRAAPGCFSAVPWWLQSLALLLPAAPRAERQLCSLPAPRGSPEQHSTTTHNFQEQFTHAGETKIQNPSPTSDQTLLGLPHEVSTGLIFRGKWLPKLQRSGCCNCTSNMTWCCTHTAPRATLQGFLYTHNSGTRDIQPDWLLQLSESLEITTFPTYLKKRWKHDMTRSWLILRLRFCLMAFSS